MSKPLFFLLVLILLVSVTACGPRADSPAPEASSEPAAQVVEVVEEALVAVAVLTPRAGTEVAGTVTFTQTGEGVVVAAHVSGVAPGLHGIHLHEKGDCSAEDFTSTGGHFNPTEDPHGGPNDSIRHAGDFGNIEVGADGSGHLELLTDMLTVEPTAETTVIGRAVILHEGEDDLESQPTGAAGARLACGTVVMEGLEEVPGMEEIEVEEESPNPEAVY
ncbi:MAG: superoxide dismutase family protein [Thermoanaerobaculia bacterium]